MWDSTNYNGENLTFNYGVVENLDKSNNVTYPILITIATNARLTQNQTVNCQLTAGSTTDNFTFDVVPTGLKVILKHIISL